MAGTDCSEIGSGTCPCGNGVITIECCTPDHPWARESQFTYHARLKCFFCEEVYDLREDSNRKPTLYFKADLLEKQKLEATAQHAMKLCSEHPYVATLKIALETRLEQEKFYAGKHRILVHAGCHPGTIESFRRSRGFYHFSATSSVKLMDFLDMDCPSLRSLCEAYDEAQNLSYAYRPKAVITGIHGMNF